MSMSVVACLIALGCLFLLFKLAGLLLKLVIMVVILGSAYYCLSPHFGWPPLPF